MIVDLKQFITKLKTNHDLTVGCIVDTNVMFAADYSLDSFNEWAEEVIRELNANGIPIYTNINVRSEFIDLHRRVLIPEGLIDFYKDWSDELDGEITQKLKSLKTRIDKATNTNKTFKLSDSEIKTFKKLLSSRSDQNGVDGWKMFCEDYFYGYIRNVWEEAIKTMNIQFLGTRAIESRNHFDAELKWPDMIEIIGKTGIGSSDAMIVNLFLKSKIPTIITADIDIQDSVRDLDNSQKYILVPSLK